MNKHELIQAIAAKSGVSQKETASVLNGLIEVVTETLHAGEEIKLVGFGTFSVTHRAERMSRNPKTGEPAVVPAMNVAKFKASKVLKESLNA